MSLITPWCSLKQCFKQCRNLHVKQLPFPTLPWLTLQVMQVRSASLQLKVNFRREDLYEMAAADDA